MMVYITPLLVLVGTASRVVLGKVLHSPFPPDNIPYTPSTYDAQSSLEASW